MSFCQDCRKFTTNEPGEAEINSVDVRFDWEEGSGEVDVDARLVILCGECGGEKKEYSDSVSIGFEHDCPKKGDEEGEDSWDDPEFDTEIEERYQDKDAKGKPIKPRYQKKFYRLPLLTTMECPRCGETVTIGDQIEGQASSFDSV